MNKNTRNIFLIFLIILVSPSAIAEKKDKIFALVPKHMHPFFERAHQGCERAAKEIDGVSCRYVIPTQPSTDEQVQILHDLIVQKVDGIAVSPFNAASLAGVLRSAEKAGIPVITFDADLHESDRELRKAYVGSRNYDIGVMLAKRLMELKPDGGNVVIHSGETSADNLEERIKGVRDTLKKSNWSEVQGSPVYCNGDDMLAVQQFEELLLKHSDLDGYIAVGAWPQVPQSAYRRVAKKYNQRIQKDDLVIVVADTLEMQMKILEDKLSHGQIGQRPNEMGYRSMFVLNDIVQGKKVEDYIYTGLDNCTPENAKNCVGGR